MLVQIRITVLLRRFEELKWLKACMNLAGFVLHYCMLCKASPGATAALGECAGALIQKAFAKPSPSSF